MAEEIITPIEEVEPDTDYVSIINEMKQNTVPKDKYDRLREENVKLMRSLANGEQIEVEAPNKPDISKLRNDLFGEDASDMSNLDFVSKSLELRQALIGNGEPDPFLPQGKRIAPDDSDIAVAQRVADALQSCIDYADGDSTIFTNELQRITVDTAPMAIRGNRRR